MKLLYNVVITQIVLLVQQCFIRKDHQNLHIMFGHGDMLKTMWLSEVRFCLYLRFSINVHLKIQELKRQSEFVR